MDVERREGRIREMSDEERLIVKGERWCEEGECNLVLGR